MGNMRVQEAMESFAFRDKIRMKLHIVQQCYCSIAAKIPFCFPLILLPRGLDLSATPLH